MMKKRATCLLAIGLLGLLGVGSGALRLGQSRALADDRAAGNATASALLGEDSPASPECAP